MRSCAKAREEDIVQFGRRSVRSLRYIPRGIWNFINSTFFCSGILVISAAFISSYYAIYSKCSDEVASDNISAGMLVEELFARGDTMKQTFVTWSYASENQGKMIWRSTEPTNCEAVKARQIFFERLKAAKNHRKAGLYSEFGGRSDSDLFNHARRTLGRWNPRLWNDPIADRRATNGKVLAPIEDPIPNTPFSISSKEWMSYFNKLNPSRQLLVILDTEVANLIDQFPAKEKRRKESIFSVSEQSSWILDEINLFDKLLAAYSALKDDPMQDARTENANNLLRRSAGQNELIEMRVCHNKLPKFMRWLVRYFEPRTRSYVT